MDAEEKRIRQRLRDDFPHYAEKCLTIRLKEVDGKSGKTAKFVLNKAQRYIHKRLEEQKRETGKVRAYILKGRQQGCSTYIGGRFYHETTHSPGFKTFILTHLEDATSNLFKMVNRFHDNCPDLVKPSTSHSNRKELVFDKLDSAYSLGTAGSGAVGRSDTIDLFHGSECAFWKNVKELKTGVFQAASAAEEIILESTANGFDEMFFPGWQAAEAGLSEYIAIFVPWFWQTEYFTSPGKDFVMTPEEEKLFSEYRNDGMTKGNILWRRLKLLNDFSGDEILFKQEYPCCAHEAFQVTGLNPFITPGCVLAARKRTDVEPGGAHIVGLDPARGGDRTSFYHRQGRVAWAGKIYKTPDTKAIIGEIRRLFEEPDNPENPIDWMFIDIGGLGGPIYDQVKDMPFGRFIIPVNFGSTDVFNPERYLNKRAEMWGEARDWLEDEAEPVSIPDVDSLQADACGPGFKYDSRQRLVLESKEDMKKRGVRSTDEFDSLALTFAQPVKPRHGYSAQARQDRKRKRRIA